MEKLPEQLLLSLITYFGSDPKRIGHAQKVHSFAKTIGTLEQLDNSSMLILETAAILHDIGIKESEKKYKSAAGKYQEIEGPAVAKNILSQYDLPEEVVERVLFLIGNHHTYSEIDAPDFQILVEADFLVNMHEDNCSERQVKSIVEKYFKTMHGTHIANTIFVAS